MNESIKARGIEVLYSIDGSPDTLYKDLWHEHGYIDREDLLSKILVNYKVDANNVSSLVIHSIVACTRESTVIDPQPDRVVKSYEEYQEGTLLEDGNVFFDGNPWLSYKL